MGCSFVSWRLFAAAVMVGAGCSGDNGVLSEGGHEQARDLRLQAALADRSVNSTGRAHNAALRGVGRVLEARWDRRWTKRQKFQAFREAILEYVEANVDGIDARLVVTAEIERAIRLMGPSGAFWEFRDASKDGFSTTSTIPDSGYAYEPYVAEIEQLTADQSLVPADSRTGISYVVVNAATVLTGQDLEVVQSAAALADSSITFWEAEGTAALNGSGDPEWSAAFTSEGEWETSPGAPSARMEEDCVGWCKFFQAVKIIAYGDVTAGLSTAIIAVKTGVGAAVAAEAGIAGGFIGSAITAGALALAAEL